MSRRMRRIPAKIVQIDKLQESSRVAVLGTIIQKSDSAVIIDDGTGQVEVVLNEDVPYDVKDIVRVFGRVYGQTIEAEFIQDAKDINTDLYKKSANIIKKYHEF